MGKRSRAGQLGMSLIEVSVMAGLGLVMIGAFMQVILSSRVDLERLGSKVATVQLRNSMDTALLGRVGDSVFRVDPNQGTEIFESLNAYSPILPGTRECRSVSATDEFPANQKIPYSAMLLGGPIFESGKKLPNSGTITVDEAFLVQVVADGTPCTTGENSPCHEGECNFLNVVKLSSSRPGWPGDVTIQQPILCRTQWVANATSGGYEQLGYCRLNGSAATTPEPSGSPSPCPGDVNFDGYTTQEDYDIVRASEGFFGGADVPCDYLRLFVPINLNGAAGSRIDSPDWSPIKENLGCKQPLLKRCFINSPAYYVWSQVAGAWTTTAPNTPPVTIEDIQAIEWCLNKMSSEILPPELQPFPLPSPSKSCGAINVDGSRKTLGVNSVTIQHRDVMLARAMLALTSDGPEFAQSCPNSMPSFSTVGLSCQGGIQQWQGGIIGQ